MHDNEYDESTLVGKAKAAEQSGEAADGHTMADLPAQLGNREFTRQVVGPVQRSGPSQGAGPLDPEIESDIRSAQGGGRPLDDHVKADMESHLGADLSGVRVHADRQGDMLSRSVQADAFTTGSDVFFRSDKYSPDSGDGRSLLAHELTHVVQQSSGQVPDESVVSQPDDPHEIEARAVADSLSSAPPATTGAAVSREELLDEEELPAEEMGISRQETSDEEELDELET